MCWRRLRDRCGRRLASPRHLSCRPRACSLLCASACTRTPQPQSQQRRRPQGRSHPLRGWTSGCADSVAAAACRPPCRQRTCARHARCCALLRERERHSRRASSGAAPTGTVARSAAAASGPLGLQLAISAVRRAHARCYALLHVRGRHSRGASRSAATTGAVARGCPAAAARRRRLAGCRGSEPAGCPPHRVKAHSATGAGPPASARRP